MVDEMKQSWIGIQWKKYKMIFAIICEQQKNNFITCDHNNFITCDYNLIILIYKYNNR